MMITKDFIFLHFPKTAGTSLRTYMLNEAKLEYASSHAHISSIPEIHKGKRIIVFLRNPFDWYVSNYFFHLDKKFLSGAPVYALSCGDYLDFNCYLKNALNIPDFLNNNPKAKILWYERQAHYINKHPENYWFKRKNLHRALPKVQTEYQMYMDAIGIDIDLNIEVYDYSDFKSIMEGFGFKDLPFKNVSDHSDYKKYYNNDTIELVYEKHKDIMDYLNFKF